MIKKEGRTWVLYNKAGSKVLSKHTTKKAAIAQEQAIEISKVKSKKKS